MSYAPAVERLPHAIMAIPQRPLSEETNSQSLVLYPQLQLLCVFASHRPWRRASRSQVTNARHHHPHTPPKARPHAASQSLRTAPLSAQQASQVCTHNAVWRTRGAAGALPLEVMPTIPQARSTHRPLDMDRTPVKCASFFFSYRLQLLHCLGFEVESNSHRHRRDQCPTTSTRPPPTGRRPQEYLCIATISAPQTPAHRL